MSLHKLKIYGPNKSIASFRSFTLGFRGDLGRGKDCYPNTGLYRAVQGHRYKGEWNSNYRCNSILTIMEIQVEKHGDCGHKA